MKLPIFNIRLSISSLVRGINIIEPVLSFFLMILLFDKSNFNNFEDDYFNNFEDDYFNYNDYDLYYKDQVCF